MNKEAEQEPISSSIDVVTGVTSTPAKAGTQKNSITEES